MKPWTVGTPMIAAPVPASTACGTTDTPGGSGGSGEDGLTIGVLLPETETSRYETFDRPLIAQAVEDRYEECSVRHANAGRR
ncbi:hypothetical protein [Streptomyces sp. NK15101]|uniref:hypothetical protein n=1 Tax=Streptomyces sp. NK15101 TaxID=2873261 RepID=UPI001CEDD93F|nr:hypothetical protein [Streptomyces sp. NK15101]